MREGLISTIKKFNIYYYLYTVNRYNFIRVCKNFSSKKFPGENFTRNEC